MIYEEYLSFNSMNALLNEKELKLPYPLEYTLTQIEKIKKKLPKSYDNIARLLAVSRPVVELIFHERGIEDSEPAAHSKGRPKLSTVTLVLVHLFAKTIISDSYRHFERTLNAHPLWLKALGLTKSPSHTTLSKFRAKMGATFFDTVFRELTELLFALGLLKKDEQVIIDSAPIEACQNFARSNAGLRINEERLQEFFDTIDITPALNLIAPAGSQGRKAEYTNEVLLKFVMFEKLCGFLSCSQALKHLKTHPNAAKILGFESTSLPSSVTITNFLRRIPPIPWLMRVLIEPMTEFFNDHPQYEDNDEPLSFFFRSF
jgi:transposase